VRPDFSFIATTPMQISCLNLLGRMILRRELAYRFQIVNAQLPVITFKRLLKFLWLIFNLAN
jgi:hypothetical protein